MAWEASEIAAPEAREEQAGAEQRRRVRRGRFLAALCVIAFVGIMMATLWSRHEAWQKEIQHGMRLLGVHCHNYHAAYGQGPTCLADLEAFVIREGAGTQLRPEDELIFSMIHAGHFVLIWNASFDGEPLSERMLGYESRTPKGGGSVLLADGSVRYCSAEGFRVLREIESLGD